MNQKDVSSIASAWGHLLATLSAYVGALFAVLNYAAPSAGEQLLTLTSSEKTVEAVVTLVLLAYLDDKPGILAIWAKLKQLRADAAALKVSAVAGDLGTILNEIRTGQQAAADQVAAILAVLPPDWRTTVEQKLAAGATPPTPPAQSGRAALSFLGLLVAGAVVALGALAGCANNPALTPQQQAEQALSLPCQSYSAILHALAPYRAAGKLSAGQIAGVDQAEAWAGPVCTGPAPADLSTALHDVNKALTNLKAVQGAVAPAAAVPAATGASK